MSSVEPVPTRATGARQRYRRVALRRGVTRGEIREAWFQYLADQWVGKRNLRVFKDIRKSARDGGGELAVKYLNGDRTAKEFFHEIQVVCLKRYVRLLNKHSVTRFINMNRPAYVTLSRNIAFEVLQVFEGVNVNDKTAFCTAAAKVWHRFVQVLHSSHGLPSVQRMRRTNGSDSDAETAVLDNGNFRTTMTPAQRAAWEAIIA